MDLVLHYLDEYLLTPYIYPSSWPEEDIFRQSLTVYVVIVVGGWLLYFLTASIGHLFLFDKRYRLHPNFIPNQELKEIAYASWSIPYMGILTLPVFLLEIYGYSKLYMGAHNVLDSNETDNGTQGEQSGATDSVFQDLPFIALSVTAFLMFTDCLIYWIHRVLHHRLLYKYLHKPHHRWKIPTPYASHAFHPVDGFLQSVPYHIYPFLFPLHKVVYLVLFVVVNIWTVSIHDGDYKVPALLEPFINGSAHHTDHHVLYKYNYGQFFTLWDRIGGSFRYPTQLGEGNKLLEEAESFQKQKKEE